MYIAPDTNIKILKNVPLDTTYDHTIYFATESAQASYFESKAKYSLTNQSYQRVQRGWIRVNIQAENLYDCNYVMFRNSAFGTKWFYAFIKSVEYINNAVSQIEFEIDVMQTWHFDYNLGMSFVEREHASTDVIGDNLIEEGFATGEYVTDGFTMPSALNIYSICVAATFDKEYTNVGGNIYGGIYSGLEYNFFNNDATGRAEVVAFIENAGTKVDGIVSVYMCPAIFVREAGTESSVTYPLAIDKNWSSIGGYIPKNNKLFTYPYNALYVTNLQGASATFPYEWFSSSQCNFKLVGNCSPDTTIILAPVGFKGSGEEPNWDERLTLTGFPQCSFNTDSYKAWLAQTCVSLPYTIATGATGAITDISQKQMIAGISNSQMAQLSADIAPAMAFVNLANTVLNICGQGMKASFAPNRPHGGQANSALVSAGIMNFAFTCKHIRPEIARIIDNYFTMFGYACKRVKIPNRNVRDHWTYTKTVGCKIIGSIPCDDEKTICQIYDKGITFWNNGDEIGQYNLDNPPKGIAPNP